MFHKDAFSDGPGLGITDWVESPFTEYTFVRYSSSLLPLSPPPLWIPTRQAGGAQLLQP